MVAPFLNHAAMSYIFHGRRSDQLANVAEWSEETAAALAEAQEQLQVLGHCTSNVLVPPIRMNMNLSFRA